MNCLKIKQILLILLLGNAGGLGAQFRSPYLANQINLKEADTNLLQMSVYMNNYLKNNEYFGPLYHGYTLFGTSLRTGLAYTPSKFMRVEGGIFLQNDFGSPEFSVVRPYFSVKLKKRNHEVIFGNLEGSANHDLIEPLFDPERCMTHPLENGLQYKVDGKHIRSDAWIDWVHIENAGKNIQEEIHAGFSFKLYLINKERIKLSLPLEGMVWHLGGQLNESAYPVESIGNGAAGIRFDLSGKENAFIQTIQLQSFAVGYVHSSDSYLRRYPDGRGYYSSLSVETKPGLFLTCSYFFGHHYITETGWNLYQSVSSHYGSYYENYRDVLVLRLGYRKEIHPGIWIDVRFEPYYDIGSSLLEYSYGGFITWKHDFTLKKIK